MEKVTKEKLRLAVKDSFSFMEVLEKIGRKKSGGNHSHYKKKIIGLGIDTSHFLGNASNKGKIPINKKTKEEILVLRLKGTRQKTTQLVRAMLESGIEHKCSLCGVGTEWLGNALTLDVDHINENWLDDRLSNLRFLCPNCHSQYSRRLRGN